MWAATRTHPNGTKNKLDCIGVSSNVAGDLKAKVILIKPVTMYREDLPADWSTGDDPQDYHLSDHSAVIMQIKSNCQLRIKKLSHISCHHSYAHQGSSSNSLRLLLN